MAGHKTLRSFLRASPKGVTHMDVLSTKTPGAFLRASPEGVKHRDVLSTKKDPARAGSITVISLMRR